MLPPDYFIYEELKRQRQQREEANRPQLELDIPYQTPWPRERDHRSPERGDSFEEGQRGEVIIQM